LPVYTINKGTPPTKVVPIGGDFGQVFPHGIDFSRFGSFASLPDGSHVQKHAFQQGVPVEPEHLPKQLIWGHGELKKGVADLLKHNSIFIASENIRRVVEAHEPGVHQFVPVEIRWKNGGSAIPYYWLYPCNRIDSIHDTLTTFDCKEFKPGIKRWLHRQGGKIVYDLNKIGDVHMWLDRGYLNTDGIMISQALRSAFEAAKLTGILYFEREAV
jgi:hypothetical protein